MQNVHRPAAGVMRERCWPRWMLLWAWLAWAPVHAAAQPAAAPGSASLSAAPVAVDVRPTASDAEIQSRLQRVLDATGWFGPVRVRADQGVVFLDGQAPSADLQRWAGELARNTQGVVAVVNRLALPEPSIRDWRPAMAGLMSLWAGFVRALPFLAFGLLVMAVSFGAGMLVTRGTRALLRHRIRARLLRSVLAGAAGALVFLLGTYVVLRVAGLTQLALTVVGGTGLVGLAVGIAFRDITENFLASIFLSMQHPFETGDLVEIAGVTGYVQQLNVRGTILMTLDGNLVQIPNATVYKVNLRNFSANANRREDFEVGIGYEVAIQHAQDVARQVLAHHPAVLRDPEPMVLVDGLGASTVNLRVYFWLDGRAYSWLKVRSSVIRLVKAAFQQAGISMPDGAREVVFPRGVPVTWAEGAPDGPRAPPSPPAAPPPDGDQAVCTSAEAGLSSEATVIEAQALQAQPLHADDNLLQRAPAGPD